MTERKGTGATKITLGRSLVASVHERFEDCNGRWVREDDGTGGLKKTWVTDKRSLGWWIRVDGSSAVYVGDEKPGIIAGDHVRMTIERIP